MANRHSGYASFYKAKPLPAEGEQSPLFARSVNMPPGAAAQRQSQKTLFTSASEAYLKFSYHNDADGAILDQLWQQLNDQDDSLILSENCKFTGPLYHSLYSDNPNSHHHHHR